MTLDGGQFVFTKELEIDVLFIVGEKSLLKTHIRQTDTCQVPFRTL